MQEIRYTCNRIGKVNVYDIYKYTNQNIITWGTLVKFIIVKLTIELFVILYVYKKRNNFFC